MERDLSTLPNHTPGVEIERIAAPMQNLSIASIASCGDQSVEIDVGIPGATARIASMFSETYLGGKRC